MVGWHHRLAGQEFEQAPGDSEDRQAWPAAAHGIARVRHVLATEQQRRATEQSAQK